MLYPKNEYFICKFCKKRVTLNIGTTTPTLIRHIEDYHEDKKKDYWDIPIHEMIKECYKIVPEHS